MEEKEAREILKIPREKMEGLCEEINNMKRQAELTILQALEERDNEIKRLKFYVQAKEQEHKYDVKMIDDVKGKAVELYNEIEQLKQEKTQAYMEGYTVRESLANDICKNICDKGKKIKELEKQIELMAPEIGCSYCIYYDEEKEFKNCSEEKCTEGVKQYFENKAKGVDFDPFEKGQDNG